MTYSSDDFEKLCDSFAGLYEDDFLAMLKHTEAYLGFAGSVAIGLSSFEFIDNTEAYSLSLETETTPVAIAL